jgi:hypothetical protein
LILRLMHFPHSAARKSIKIKKVEPKNKDPVGND